MVAPYFIGTNKKSVERNKHPRTARRLVPANIDPPRDQSTDAAETLVSFLLLCRQKDRLTTRVGDPGLPHWSEKDTERTDGLPIQQIVHRGSQMGNTDPSSANTHSLHGTLCTLTCSTVRRLSALAFGIGLRLCFDSPTDTCQLWNLD